MAAFLNALREEGTKDDCLRMLEKMWTDELALRAELSAMTARAEAAEAALEAMRKEPTAEEVEAVANAIEYYLYVGITDDGQIEAAKAALTAFLAARSQAVDNG